MKASDWHSDCQQTAQTHGQALGRARVSTSSETATTQALQAVFAACWVKAMTGSCACCDVRLDQAGALRS